MSKRPSQTKKRLTCSQQHVNLQASCVLSSLSCLPTATSSNLQNYLVVTRAYHRGAKVCSLLPSSFGACSELQNYSEVTRAYRMGPQGLPYFGHSGVLAAARNLAAELDGGHPCFLNWIPSAYREPQLRYSTVCYGTVWYSTLWYSTVWYSAAQSSALTCSTVEHSTSNYCTAQCSTVQYSTVHFTIHFLEHSLSRPSVLCCAAGLLTRLLGPGGSVRGMTCALWGTPWGGRGIAHRAPGEQDWTSSWPPSSPSPLPLPLSSSPLPLAPFLVPTPPPFLGLMGQSNWIYF